MGKTLQGRILWRTHSFNGRNFGLHHAALTGFDSPGATGDLLPAFGSAVRAPDESSPRLRPPHNCKTQCRHDHAAPRPGVAVRGDRGKSL
jgi:hypothetical protein